MKTFKNSLLLALSWFVLVTILLIIPGRKLPNISWVGKFQIDKIVHIFLFFILTMNFCRASFNFYNEQKWFWMIALFCSLYGVSMEFVQENFVLNRSFDNGDIVADIIGCYSFLIFLNIKPQFFKN